MADTPADTAAPDAGGDTAAPSSPGGDLSQGYCIEISVLPDGSYKVSGPEPLAEEASEDQGEPAGSEVGDDFTSIGAALKKVIDIVKENPVGNDADAQFQAGYGAG